MRTKSQPDGGNIQCWVRVEGWKQSLGPVFLSLSFFFLIFFFYFLALPGSMHNLSFPTRDQTLPPTVEASVLITGPSGKSFVFLSAGYLRWSGLRETQRELNLFSFIFPSPAVFLCVSHSAVSNSLWPHRLQPASPLCPWHSPGKITRVGCHFLLQGIFPVQALNPGFLHCRWILYGLIHQGSPLYS